MGADVVIMAVSAIEGWTTEDAILLDKIKRTKVSTFYLFTIITLLTLKVITRCNELFIIIN